MESKEASTSRRRRANLRDANSALYKIWELGKRILLVWTPSPGGVRVLSAPHDLPAAFLVSRREPVRWDPRLGDVEGTAERSAEVFLTELLSGERRVSDAGITAAAHILGQSIVDIPLPHPGLFAPGDVAGIDELMRRHGMSFDQGRAVFMLDIVNFSLFKPVEQVTQINSLAYSLNWAHSRLLHRRIDIRFARITTGDGFYIWNRDTGIDANRNLYHLMHLTLANNAIAQRDAVGATVPKLKAAYYVGSFYDIYQAEGLRPLPDNIIVGEATIEIARIIEKAKPGQILVGNFRTKLPVSRGGGRRELIELDAVGFIEHLQDSLMDLEGLDLAGDRIDAIRCYLTGDKQPNGSYDVTRFRVLDKHGMSRTVFNAKVNIASQHGAPIFLGTRNVDVALQREAVDAAADRVPSARAPVRAPAR